MSAPRLTLLMNGAGGDAGIGNLFVDALATQYPARMFRFFTSGGRGFPMLPSIAETVLRRYRLPRLLERIETFSREHRAEGLLAILNAPSIIYAARPAAERLGVPLYAMVWDPPEYLALNLRFGQAATGRLLRAFDDALRGATALAVIGEGMADRYGRSFRGQPVIVRHGVHPDLWREARDPLRWAGPLVIGFAGSLYAKAEWRALLAALESVNYEVCGRPVFVKLIGRVPLRGVPVPPRVHCTGTLALEDTIAALGDVDVSYLPYWFDSEHAEVVRLSFPSKLSTYAAAGAPVFYHGPADSSPADFFRRYPMGVACHSLEPRPIVEALGQLAGDAGLYRAAHTSCRRALVDELGLDVMAGRFAQFMGIA